MKSLATLLLGILLGVPIPPPSAEATTGNRKTTRACRLEVLKQNWDAFRQRGNQNLRKRRMPFWNPTKIRLATRLLVREGIPLSYTFLRSVSLPHIDQLLQTHFEDPAVNVRSYVAALATHKLSLGRLSLENGILFHSPEKLLGYSLTESEWASVAAQLLESRPHLTSAELLAGVVLPFAELGAALTGQEVTGPDVWLWAQYFDSGWGHTVTDYRRKSTPVQTLRRRQKDSIDLSAEQVQGIAMQLLADHPYLSRVGANLTSNYAPSVRRIAASRYGLVLSGVASINRAANLHHGGWAQLKGRIMRESPNLGLVTTNREMVYDASGAGHYSNLIGRSVPPPQVQAELAEWELRLEKELLSFPPPRRAVLRLLVEHVQSSSDVLSPAQAIEYLSSHPEGTGGQAEAEKVLSDLQEILSRAA